MIDVDRLKEALTYEEDLRNDLGIAWEGALNTESCFALFDTITAAARLVVAGQPLWWCEVHKAETINSFDPPEEQRWCWLFVDDDNPEGPCRMVEGWWFSTGKDTDR